MDDIDAGPEGAEPARPDTPPDGTAETPPPPGIDATVAHAARVYDYLLGGTENFPIDRQVAERNAAAYGGLEETRTEVRANRAFLGRAVRYLVRDAGVRQFLDLGTGLPSENHVHTVAQREAPDARVVYVDNDPLVLTHAATLLSSTSEGSAAFIIGDVRQPEGILLRAEATLDFDQPVAIILSAVLHLLPDEDDPYGIVARLLDAVPSGSHLVIAHMGADINTANMSRLVEEAERHRAATTFTFAVRTREQMNRFLAGLDLVEPGLVTVEQWRPPTPPTRESGVYAVVARKP